MSSFHLQIVTPDGLFFEGSAELLKVRTTNGDVGIMAQHVNYVAALGMGEAVVEAQGTRRHAACIGGMLAVLGGEVRLIATTFEWSEQIVAERAKQYLQRAEARLQDPAGTPEEKRLAQAAQRRAQVRLSVSEQK